MRSTAARWSLAVALLAALVVAPGSPGIAGAAATQSTNDTDATIMRIDLRSNGDARWTVTMRFVFDSANETRAFDRLAADFRDGDVPPSVDVFRHAAALAGESTGRPMAIENVSRAIATGNGTGQLVLSFTWTAFAATPDDRLVIGDAFTTPSGTWLPRLAARQELIIAFPAGYAPTSTSHQLDNGTFHIAGPARFAPGEPSATLVRRGTVGTTTGGTERGVGNETPGTTVTTDTPTPDPPAGGFGPVLGIGSVLALVALLSYLVVRRRRVDEVGGGTASTTPDDGAPPPPTQSTDGAGDGAAEPLLSDEERVLRLLHRNEGRMKQAAIVEETDWSNAKVSQLLSEMDDRDEIDKLRIGRENLISLPDESIDEFD